MFYTHCDTSSLTVYKYHSIFFCVCSDTFVRIINKYNWYLILEIKLFATLAKVHVHELVVVLCWRQALFRNSKYNLLIYIWRGYMIHTYANLI